MAGKPITDRFVSRFFLPKAANDAFKKLYNTAVSHGVSIEKAKPNELAGGGTASYAWAHNEIKISPAIWENGPPNPPYDLWISTTHELLHAYEWNVTWRQFGKSVEERYNWHTTNKESMTEQEYINTMLASERQGYMKGAQIVLDYLVQTNVITAANRESMLNRQRQDFNVNATPRYTTQFRGLYRNFPSLNAFK